MSHHSGALPDEHPFAPFVRILGKGKNGSRDLTAQEACDAMSMILSGQIEDVQLGAFLMLMRVKEETPDELAGFVKAARRFVAPPVPVKVDLDWSSYAGKRRHYPWYLFAALLLAQNGVRVLMHGSAGHTAERIYTEDALAFLGIKAATNWDTATTQLETSGFCYFPLQVLCPPLHYMIDLRRILGLRSPVHTLARLLNPADAPAVMQGIFHPGYRPVHQLAAQALGFRNVAVIKGEAGETERNPDSECLVQSVVEGELHDEVWPALFAQRHLKEADMQLEDWRAVWRGQKSHEYGEAAITGTLAIALRLLKRADSREAAEAMATNWWQERNRSAF